ncbi:MAG TPA: hypothetical protein VJV03_06920 [Pyrinomonadaceae bacterium]|nr:hypothetical protein [Pyrinomonadaceae bacterium]
MDIRNRQSERGSAQLKLLVFIIVIAIVAYAGYLYIPVSYNAYLFKDLMQQKVNTAAALGHPANWVQEQLVRSAPEYEIPQDAEIVPALKDGRVEVQVRYTKPIEFPGYVYEYVFDHTAHSTEFLTK